eukprot:364203-Chlamydomonas_euryale.AAC.9
MTGTPANQQTAGPPGKAPARCPAVHSCAHPPPFFTLAVPSVCHALLPFPVYAMPTFLSRLKSSSAFGRCVLLTSPSPPSAPFTGLQQMPHQGHLPAALPVPSPSSHPVTARARPLAVREAGISVCAGGIIGLGEGEADRVGLIHQLATLPAHPESVPINRLVAVKGTPFEGHEAPSGLDLVRCIATARVVMPRTVVRLSAGRLDLSVADQALAFMAGANSIFDGDKLLTTANNDRDDDAAMFGLLGLNSRPAFLPYASGNDSSRDFESAGSGGDGTATEAESPTAAGGAQRAAAGGCCGGGCS